MNRFLSILLIFAFACAAPKAKIPTEMKYNHHNTDDNALTSEVLSNIFLIYHGTQYGTCFQLSLGGKDYLVTARHLFEGIQNNTLVDVLINHKDGNKSLKPTLLVHKNSNIDIAVLDMHSNNIKEEYVDVGSEGSYASQECFFAGFPLQLSMVDKVGLNKGFPLPLIRKGIVSAFLWEKDQSIILLDGNNITGQSGSPVVVFNSSLGGKNKHKFRLIGIVRGYIPDQKEVKLTNETFVYPENTGIVVTFDAGHIKDIIGQNNEK